MALTLTIGGVDFKPQYKTNSAQIRQILQNRGNAMDIEIIKKSGDNTPEEGKEIIFKDGARFLFGGYVSKSSPIETGEGQLFNYRLEATDYTYVLINKSAQKVYENQTLKAIVEDLMTTYVDSGYAITTTNVDTGPTIDTIAFDHISLRKCFEKLAKVTSYEWWITMDKDLYFKPKSGTSAPEQITDSSDNHDSLNIETDLTQVRNSIVVKGGVEETSAYFTQNIEADGTAREWILREKPTDVQHIKEDAAAQNFGEDPTDEETGNDYMYNKAEKYVRVVSGDPTPVATTDIEVSYKYDVPVIIIMESASSKAAMKALEGGDGIHSYTITERSILSKAEARQRALKELLEYANPKITGIFTTRTGLLTAGSFFEPGQELVVNSPSWGINTDTNYLIQEVITTLVEDGSNIEYTYTVRFGGRLIDTVAFLESLAGDEKVIKATKEIDTIYAITEEVIISENIARDPNTNLIVETITIGEGIVRTNYTPPFQWGPGGSPQMVWNKFEWG